MQYLQCEDYNNLIYIYANIQKQFLQTGVVLELIQTEF